jgi:hypothetical protein
MNSASRNENEHGVRPIKILAQNCGDGSAFIGFNFSLWAAGMVSSSVNLAWTLASRGCKIAWLSFVPRLSFYATPEGLTLTSVLIFLFPGSSKPQLLSGTPSK